VQCDNRGQIIDPPQLGRGIALSRVRRHGVLGEEQPRAVGVPCRRSDSSLVLTVLVSGSIIPPEVDDQERSRPVEEWAQDPVLYGYRTGVDDRGDSRTASRVPGLWLGLDVQAQLVSPADDLSSLNACRSLR
jgi:hypothetical protein